MKIKISVIVFCVLCMFMSPNLTAFAKNDTKRAEYDFKKDLRAYIEYPHSFRESDWRFCFGDIDEFFDMTYFAAERMWVGTEAYTQVEETRVHPGNNDSIVIVWIAPFSGTLTYNGTVQNPFEGDESDGLLFAIYDKDKEIVSELALSKSENDPKDFSGTAEVKKDEYLYFVVDCLANNQHDSTYLNIFMTLEGDSGDIITPDRGNERDGCNYMPLIIAATIVSVCGALTAVIVLVVRRKNGVR